MQSRQGLASEYIEFWAIGNESCDVKATEMIGSKYGHFGNCSVLFGCRNSPQYVYWFVITVFRIWVFLIPMRVRMGGQNAK